MDNFENTSSELDTTDNSVPTLGQQVVATLAISAASVVGTFAAMAIGGGVLLAVGKVGEKISERRALKGLRTSETILDSTEDE